MGVIGKLQWRAKVLWSKLRGKEVCGWETVLKEVLRRHRDASYSHRIEFAEVGENLVQVHFPNGLKIYWPRAYNKSFVIVPFLYDEIYGPQGCIYELPGRVEVREGDVVIDGGACEGLFSIYCLTKGATVVCVEPNPTMAEALRKTLHPWLENGRAIVVQKLLGDEKGEAELYINLDNVGGSSTDEIWVKKSVESEIPVVKASIVTLDELVEELNLSKVDLVKLDVEGAERKVIVGSKKTIEKFHPKWSVACYHLKDDYPVLPNLLKSYDSSYQLGFSFTWFLVLTGEPPYLRPKVIFAY